jgi:hypothetical protein
MYMLLMGLSVAFIGIAFAAVAFAAATHPNSSESPAQSELPVTKAVPASARFFVEHVTAPRPPLPQIPVEILLQQIENHVRLEHAAAESFVALPTYAKLHSKTTSSFLN